jgi:lipoyl-dependent peroxiredoxin
MQRNAKAIWQDSLRAGEGRLTTQSASLKDTRFSFPTRFGNEHGANPEELIAAAHAACFSMAFVYFAEAAGATPRRVETSAEFHFDLGANGPVVTGMHLSLRADVPELDAQRFEAVALQAKDHCMVSRLLKTSVTLEASQAQLHLPSPRRETVVNPATQPAAAPAPAAAGLPRAGSEATP